VTRAHYEKATDQTQINTDKTALLVLSVFVRVSSVASVIGIANAWHVLPDQWEVL
jgi:hypothetical protein